LQTARTFARPRPPRPETPPRPTAPGRFANPYMAAAAAAALLVVCAAALVSLTGDPRAGAPVVRLNLATIASTTAPPGWREALPSEPAGEAPYGSATVELSSATTDPAAPGAGGAPIGAAIITIPADASVEGAQASGPGLPQAPIAGLFAPGPGGPLPVIGPDGRTPAQAYARPATFDGKPRVALVIGGLGLDAAETRTAISGLPPQVTLSFVPYADGLQGWIDMARAAGHEVLLELPMQPKDYPDNDPGPKTLMADASPQQITSTLEWLLSRASGYFGVTNYLGARFLASAPAMGVFADDLRGRGLAFIDDGAAAQVGGGLPRASADRIVDDQLDGAAIDAQLTALETQASRSGQALGSGFAYPVTLAEAARWAGGLAGRGFQLVPASALMVKR